MIKNWYLQKAESEQKIILGLSVFVLFTLTYAFLYVPLKRENAQIAERIASSETEILQMHVMEKQLAALKGTGNVEKVPFSDVSNMMTEVEQIAKQQKIDPKHFNIKIQSKNSVLVTLNEINFNTTMRWLDALQNRYQITLKQVTVEPLQIGIVNMSAEISY